MKFLDYIQGVRRGKDAYRIEHEAMSDPFLSAAIEGYDSIKGNHASRIARMQASVIARTTPREANWNAWKVTAAAVAVIALLSGYFALMNHESSMAMAHEAESEKCINLYAPEVYIEQKRIELTAMMENDPSQDATIKSVVPISNLDEVIKPVEILPLYVPGTYADLKKDESNESPSTPSKKDNKKIFIANASSSILAEAKVPVTQSGNKDQNMPDKLKDAWATKEVVEVTRTRTVEVNKNNDQNVMGTTVAQEPTKSTVKQTEATAKPKVDTHEARMLAEQAGFDKLEEVTAKDLGGDALQLNEAENTTRKISRESFYRPKASTSNSFTSSGSAPRTEPEPLIGEKEYKKYLQANMVRPQDDACKDVKGKVVIQLSVDKDGNPINVLVTKGLCKSLDREAVRLVKNGPKWKYGTLRTNVEVQF